MKVYTDSLAECALALTDDGFAMPPSHMELTPGVPQPRVMQPIAHLRTALCFGHEALLLLTRQRMFMLLGCLCDTVSTDADYEARLWTETPSIIVLCQSLSGEECGYASHFAAEHSPRSRVVVMFTRIEKCVPNQAHIMLTSSDGPSAFMKAMSDLLGKQALAADSGGLA